MKSYNCNVDFNAKLIKKGLYNKILLSIMPIGHDYREILAM